MRLVGAFTHDGVARWGRNESDLLGRIDTDGDFPMGYGGFVFRGALHPGFQETLRCGHEVNDRRRCYGTFRRFVLAPPRCSSGRRTSRLGTGLTNEQPSLAYKDTGRPEDDVAETS